MPPKKADAEETKPKRIYFKDLPIGATFRFLRRRPPVGLVNAIPPVEGGICIKVSDTCFRLASLDVLFGGPGLYEALQMEVVDYANHQQRRFSRRAIAGYSRRESLKEYDPANRQPTYPFF